MSMQTLSPVRTSTITFDGVQALRGLAACMVVVYHATGLWGVAAHGEGRAGLWDNGAAGVDLFFIISGFVMAVSTLGKDDGPGAARTFMERRLVRILPLYWLITTALLVKLTMTYGRMAPQDHVLVTVPYVLTSYLLIPYRNSTGSIRAILLQGWTLYYEMFFYVCFAAALAVRGKVVRTLTVGLGLLSAVGFFYNESWPAFFSLLNPLLLEFLSGLLLGRAVQLGRSINKRAAGVLGCIALAVLFVVPAPHTLPMQRLLWGVLSFFVVQGAVCWEDSLGGRVPSWALLIGDASYSIYLAHYSAIHLSERVLVKFHILIEGAGGLGNELAVVALYIAVCVLLGLAIYRWVEWPMTRSLRQVLKLRKARIQPPFAAAGHAADV
jgi:peptidoglycan/LPS O-acetylase OafA/YrhL